MIASVVKVIVGWLLATVTRKPYWAMHPDMDLDAMARNQEALAARVRKLEGRRETS
jgi:hypothetical protein